MTYHSYIFLQSRRSKHKINLEQLEQYKIEFISTIEHSKDVVVYSYSTLGFKVNTSCMLWLQSDDVEKLQSFLNTLMQTQLGQHLKITYTLFGMVRPTQYSPSSVTHVDSSRKGGAYLIIYPFTKTQEWHMLDFSKRKELMKGHISIGKKYPQISQILLYSYGVDDQEFIVSYETDSLLEFQTLVMELRSDSVRAYTLKDTPIFTCIYRSLEKTLEFL